MSNSKNWNKKLALFASGLITALAFRLPISTAGFCVTRFNLDPSYLSIFTSRIVNAMLIGQLFGNWMGVLLTAMDGKHKLWVLSVSNWLCLISFCFALFCFSHSEEGHLTGYYWSVLTLNFFAKVSDAQCLEIAPPDSTNWYASTFSLSPAYTSSIKNLLVKLITWADEKNTVHRFATIAARSVKTTLDYRVSVLIFVNTTLLSLLISILWTSVAILTQPTGTVDKTHTACLKYLNGVIIGAILTVPGALLGVAVGSLFIKCLKYCLQDAAFVKVIEYRQIIFGIVGAAVVFVSVIAGTKDMPDESEEWVPSSRLGFNLEFAKYAGGGFGSGVFLGLCIGAMAYRFKANINRSIVLCLIAGSLVGSALGILIYERLSPFVKLKANPTSDATMNDHHQSKLVESDRVNASASNSSGETLEELLKKNIDVKDLPTLDIIKGWTKYTADGGSTGVDHNNNKWAKALQNVGKVGVTRKGEWQLSQASVDSSDVIIMDNHITIQTTLSGTSVLGQGIEFTEEKRIMDAIQEDIDKTIGDDRVRVTSVKGKGNDAGKVELNVKAKVTGNTFQSGEQAKIENAMQQGLKNIGKVDYVMMTQWDFTNATVDKSIGVFDTAIGGKDANNNINVMVKSVSGVIEGDALEVEGEEKIKKAIQEFFDRELGSRAVKLEKIETRTYQDQIKISLTMSITENVWARSLRRLKRVQLNERGFWDLSQATVAVGGVTQDMTNRLTITVNLKGAKEKQTPTEEGKKELEKVLQEILDGAFGDRAVTTEQLIAHVNAENTITIAFNLKKKENVWTKSIQNIEYVNVNNRGEWQLSKAKVDSDLLMRGNYIKIETTLSGTSMLGQTMDLTEEERLKFALQKEFSSLSSGHVTVKSVTGMTKFKGQIVFTIEGEGRGLKLHSSEKLIIRKALHNVFHNGKVKYLKNSYWYFNNAKVDLTSRAVTTIGDTIKITATDVIGATNGDAFNELDQDRIKRPLQEAINKTIGNDRVMVTSVKGQATHIGKVELIVGVEEKIKTNKVVSMRSRREVLTKKNSTTEDAHSLRKSEVIFGWVSSIVMNIFGMGTIYSVYPGIAPCSITDFRYFNTINTIILIVSTIPPIVIIYFSETSGGPEKKWEGLAKWWYVGLLFVMIQIVSMIIIVFVVHRPNSKLAKIVKSSPVTGGALTVLMVLCQVTSTSIGYAGVVGNSGYTMMTFNNTATLTTMIFMIFLGEGYLTELKKYEPGMWPTRAMGKCEGFRWLLARVFVNAWQIFTCICTTDLRRDLNTFAANNKHRNPIIYV